MKKILITGKNSYIGTSFEKWMEQYQESYKIDTLDLKDDAWRKKDFSVYDVIFHVAGIVHVKENNIDKYFKVNRDLAVEVAKKAKTEGVKQFLFFSTMAIYGVDNGKIDSETIPNPKTPYAKSKFEAEGLINKLADKLFKVAILRPPMVYGKGCKGNYPKLSNFALRLPFFPKIKNERSMIFIDNLSEFLKLLIDSELKGLFFPQNEEYVNTSQLVDKIAQAHGKKIRFTSIFNLFIYLGNKLSSTFNKVFGSLIYAKEMSREPSFFEYSTCSFDESIEKSEE